MRTFVFLLVLGLSACASTSDPIRSELSQSVFIQNSRESCSGEAISNTDVLTAAHCIMDNPVAYETYPTETKHTFVKVVKRDVKHDLMILRFSGGFHPVKLLTKDDHPRAGDPIRVVGCPLAVCNIVTTGYIAGFKEDLVVSAAGFPGMSGGGIFWNNGQDWVEIGVVQAVGQMPSMFAPNFAPMITVGSLPQNLLAFLD